MNPKVINPESAVLQQVEGHWQKLATLILWKAAGLGSITVTARDIEGLHKEFEAKGGPVLLTHGHVDSLEFRIVTVQDAERIAAYDKTVGGTA